MEMYLIIIIKHLFGQTVLLSWETKNKKTSLHHPYSQTQPENNTGVIYANDACYLDNMGSG
jgi:hypothetical protein